MNLNTIAADLRATELDWANEAADHLDSLAVEYAAQVNLQGTWRYMYKRDGYVYAYYHAVDADWMEYPGLTRDLIADAKFTNAWPDAEYRIVKRWVTEVEVVEQ